ncbi:MAG: ATP-binding protein [Nevskia sp.]|nr:ATP-binding protein [Nevskia sp.]
MDLFWQITVVEFLLNVAVFAVAVILYTPLRLLAAPLTYRWPPAERSAVGLLFGTATAAALSLPVHLEGGAPVGCQTVLLALAGPLGGLPAVLCAGLLSLIPQLLRLAQGHAADTVAVASLLVSAVAGLAFQQALIRAPQPHRRGVGYLHLPLLGVLSAVGGLSALWFTAGPAAVLASLAPALLSSIPAAVVLGTLLLHEKRRYEAERALRESEARLVHQAADLAVARDAAETASRAKSAFLANMSHELRTPLNAILGYAQLLGRDASLGERQAKAARVIQQSGEHLLMLITDVLDLSKIEAGKLELSPAAIGLEPFLAGILDIVRVRAEAKDLACAFTPAADLPRLVRADERRLRQVLLNLLGNAVKFTERGGVELRVSVVSRGAAEARLRFEVEDTGIGIAAAELRSIFDPFEQAGEPRHRSGGTGLGLSISRELVHVMNGEIGVESEPGRGSCFWFELTLPLEETAPVAPMRSRFVGYRGPRRKILVVDDVAANRAVLADALGAVGFQVCEAADGREGVEQAKATRPDLILMDIRMPVMDGAAATHQIRQHPGLQYTPVLGLSAGADAEDVSVSLAAGASAVLEKPIDVDRLLLEVGRLLRLSWTG